SAWRGSCQDAECRSTARIAARLAQRNIWPAGLLAGRVGDSLHADGQGEVGLRSSPGDSRQLSARGQRGSAGSISGQRAGASAEACHRYQLKNGGEVTPLDPATPQLLGVLKSPGSRVGSSILWLRRPSEAKPASDTSKGTPIPRACRSTVGP